MDRGWDHTENEDKVLLNQSWDLGQIKDQDMQVTSVRTIANTKDGCSSMSGGYELVSLSGEYDRHLSSVVINNVNLLFGLSLTPFKFPLLFYYIQQLNCLYSCISEITKICNSNCKCKCTCKCDSPCNGNFICLCLCECTKGEKANVCCICICKKPDNCKCVCICLCNKNGEDCCCKSETHDCKECLVKVDMSKLGFKASDIIDNLFYIKCSLQSLRTNIRVTEINKINQVMSMYSVMNVMDYEVVVNRMLEFWTFSDQSVYVCAFVMFCKCAKDLKKNYGDKLPSSFNYPLHYIKTSDVNPVSEFGRQTMAENVGNHMCLCLVIKYHLRPSLLKCILYFRNEELGTLDTLSRKFHRYNSWSGLHRDLCKLCALVLNIIYELTSLLRNRYLFHVKNICPCSFYDEKNYPHLISLALYLSSLIENIWSMDPETISTSIERLSTLYSQLEIYDLTSLRDKKVCCNPVYSMLMDKKCKPAAAQKCCCCWCAGCYNLGMILIYLCLQFKLKKATSGEDACKKVEKFCEVDDCKCTCPKGEKGVCCLLKLAASTQAQSTNAGECQDLQKLLTECGEKCGDNGCCAKLKEKLTSGLCKLLLLRCECTCTTTSDTSQEVKAWCVFFNHLDGSPRVAVLVYCKCKEPPKCCCLYQLIDNLKKKVGVNLCKEGKCVCEGLKVEELCCPDGCDAKCPPECVCKELKAKLGEICNPKGNCGANCLCKQIKDTITNLCSKRPCPCATKKGSCKCVCCKVLGASIKILTRACRQNVLEPYKRIVLDLLSSSKDKQVILRIINGIDKSMLDRITCLKMSYGSYPDSKIGLTDISSVRNWGYDTQYEHQVTTITTKVSCKLITVNGGTIDPIQNIVTHLAVVPT